MSNASNEHKEQQKTETIGWARMADGEWAVGCRLWASIVAFVQETKVSEPNIELM